MRTLRPGEVKHYGAGNTGLSDCREKGTRVAALGGSKPFCEVCHTLSLVSRTRVVTVI